MKLSALFWTLPFISFMAGYFLLHSLYIQELQTPNLIGKQLQESLYILSECNLNVRIMAQKESVDLPEGTIINQTPSATTKIKPNQSVFLVICKKPKTSRAPSLIGKSRTEYEQLLKDMPITVKSYALATQHPKGMCLAQLPQPHMTVVDNTLMVYTAVADDSKPVLMPLLIGKTAQQVQEILASYSINLIVTHPAAPEHTCTSCIVNAQRPIAGSIVSFNSQKPLSIEIQTN